MDMAKNVSNNRWKLGAACFCALFLTSTAIFAADMTLGNMASQIIKSFASLTKLITAGAYLAGMGFAVGGIMKFKQHKDNPTQITIGQPIALVFVAAALIFLPTILGMTGATMFGGSGKTGGPEGQIFQQGQ